MRIIKIKQPKLQKKAFEVLASNRNIINSNKLQLEIASENKKIEEDPSNASQQFETTINVIKKTIAFVSSALKLTEEQHNILEEEYDQAELFELSDRLYFRLQGLSDEQYDELKAEQEKEEAEGLEAEKE